MFDILRECIIKFWGIFILFAILLLWSSERRLSPLNNTGGLENHSAEKYHLRTRLRSNESQPKKVVVVLVVIVQLGPGSKPKL